MSLPAGGPSFAERPPAGSRERIGVLLVEDDDGDALIVEDLLDQGSLNVRLVRGRTVGQALDELGTGIDCVLLDLDLPDGRGLDTVGRVRAAAPRIAVIVLTGLDNEAAGEAAVDAGAQDYLIKGKVDGELLARAIRYAVGRRHAEEVQQQLRVAAVQAEENARLERGLVPHPLVNDPSIWIASSYLPGGRRSLLGGDFYDAVQTADGSLHVMVGDVSGRGPDAAALGAALRIAWRALTLSGTPGDSLLRTLDLVTEHERQRPGIFATLCMLRIEPGRTEVGVRRAGHPPPVLMTNSANNSLPLDGGGPPIGLFPGALWPESRYPLPEDWALLLYTDGVIEGGVGRPPDRLGEEGLRRLISEYVERRPGWRADPHSLLGGLLAGAQALNGDELSDDVAMLLVGTREVAAGAHEPG